MRLLLTALTLLLCSPAAFALEIKDVVRDSLADKDAIYIHVYNSEGAPMFNGNVVMYGRGATADGRAVVFAPQTGDGPLAGVVADPRGSIATQSWGRVQVWGFNDAVSVEGAASIAVSNGVALVAVGSAGTRGSSQNVDMLNTVSATGVTRSIGGVFGTSLETIATNGRGKVFINTLGR